MTPEEQARYAEVLNRLREEPEYKELAKQMILKRVAEMVRDSGITPGVPRALCDG